MVEKLVKHRCVNPHPAWGKFTGVTGTKNYWEEIEKLKRENATVIELTGLRLLSDQEKINRWNGERENEEN